MQPAIFLEHFYVTNDLFIRSTVILAEPPAPQVTHNVTFYENKDSRWFKPISHTKNVKFSCISLKFLSIFQFLKIYVAATCCYFLIFKYIYIRCSISEGKQLPVERTRVQAETASNISLNTLNIRHRQRFEETSHQASWWEQQPCSLVAFFSMSIL